REEGRQDAGSAGSLSLREDGVDRLSLKLEKHKTPSRALPVEKAIICGHWINSSELPKVGQEPTSRLYGLLFDCTDHCLESLNQVQRVIRRQPKKPR
ncbi:hypothetical protein HAX54_028676, partial [Datura stramonium]|nr:hypothetical protein [Datura stramonium]